MIYKLLLSVLLLVMCTVPQTAHAHERDHLPIHYVPRRLLGQTRLFVPTDCTVNNQLPNNYHGDPLGPKATGHMRLLLNNPNKISVQNDFVDFQYICQCMMAHDVDIWGLPETGVDWKQGYPRNRCNKILKDFYPRSRMVG
jgi:hypothetical protein